MRKTWIVDDDHLVRSYLKMLPSWEKAGFQIAADMRDGEEALAVLEDPEVDLLVTDISMPLIDGVELIRRIRQKNRQLYIIVLSCHDDFEHVKEAMKEGADEYILKNSLDEDSLYQLLLNTEKKIRDRERDFGQISGREDGKQEDYKKKYMYFNKALSGKMTPQERMQEGEAAGIRGSYQKCAVVSMQLEDWKLGEEEDFTFQNEQYCLEFLKRLRRDLERGMQDGVLYLEILYLGKGIFCCFLDLTNLNKSSQMHQQLTSVATSCYTICKKEEGSYQIGVSRICMGEEAIGQAYQQARAVMKFSFYESQEIAYYEIDKRAGNKVPQSAKELLELAEGYFRVGDGNRFAQGAQMAVEDFRKEATDSHLVLHWLRMLEERLGISRKDYNLRCVEEVEKRLRAMEEKIGKRGCVIPEGLSRPVQAAADYVLRHFREDIGLSDAAQAAGVNSAYLSYLFSREMGTGFSNFLLNQRIECASRILKETNWKIREVAAQSGFQDYYYFAKAFKKSKGLSPAQFRKDEGNNN